MLEIETLEFPAPTQADLKFIKKRKKKKNPGFYITHCAISVCSFIYSWALVLIHGGKQLLTIKDLTELPWDQDFLSVIITHGSVVFQSTRLWWSSARSSAKKEWKLRPVSLHGKIKRRHIPLQWIMINSRNPAPWIHCWSHSAACRPLSSPSNGLECQRVSQRPMCQRDECWKLLGKRIRSVYVGLMAHCQLFKCANFLKLQSSLWKRLVF